ncbi:MAG: phosphoribosylglycinamide formyltransferase [Planctomycetaceae bacterium]|nr:phosphoribosylglycinamide formyltransferase [Planctomycetaceae bacterium]
MPDSAANTHEFDAIADRPIRMGVLISGGGTTLLNFVSQIEAQTLSAVIPVVIASQRSCQGVQRAKDLGLNVLVIRPRDFMDVDAFSAAVFAELRRYDLDLVALAGFLSLLIVPEDFRWRVLNIHPSLIPAFCGQGFYGHHVHEAAIARGVKVSGCTVHFADNHYDHGPIILQEVVSVPDDATPDQLASMVFETEKVAYPEAIRRIASGHLSVADGRCFYSTDA